MALFPCPECGSQISDLAPSCPHCGYVLHRARQVATPEQPSPAPTAVPQCPTPVNGGQSAPKAAAFDFDAAAVIGCAAAAIVSLFAAGTLDNEYCALGYIGLCISLPVASWRGYRYATAIGGILAIILLAIAKYKFGYPPGMEQLGLFQRDGISTLVTILSYLGLAVGAGSSILSLLTRRLAKPQFMAVFDLLSILSYFAIFSCAYQTWRHVLLTDASTYDIYSLILMPPLVIFPIYGMVATGGNRRISALVIASAILLLDILPHTIAPPAICDGFVSDIVVREGMTIYEKISLALAIFVTLSAIIGIVATRGRREKEDVGSWAAPVMLLMTTIPIIATGMIESTGYLDIAAALFGENSLGDMFPTTYGTIAAAAGFATIALALMRRWAIAAAVSFAALIMAGTESYITISAIDSIPYAEEMSGGIHIALYCIYTALAAVAFGLLLCKAIRNPQKARCDWTAVASILLAAFIIHFILPGKFLELGVYVPLLPAGIVIMAAAASNRNLLTLISSAVLCVIIVMNREADGLQYSAGEMYTCITVAAALLVAVNIAGCLIKYRHLRARRNAA